MPRTKTTARSSTRKAELKNLELQKTIEKRDKELIEEFESTHQRRQPKRKTTSSSSKPKSAPKPKQPSYQERAETYKNKVLKEIDDYVNSRTRAEIIDAMIIVNSTPKLFLDDAKKQMELDLSPSMVFMGTKESQDSRRKLVNAMHVENKRIADIKKEFESNGFGEDNTRAFVFFGKNEWCVFTVNESTIGNLSDFMKFTQSMYPVTVLSILCLLEYESNGRIVKDYYDDISKLKIKYESELAHLHEISNNKIGEWTYVNIKEVKGRINDIDIDLTMPATMYSL